MGAGAAAGVAAAALANLPSPLDPAWWTLHVLLVAPTAAQPWVQHKLYKIGARTSVGAASGTWLAGAALQAYAGAGWVWPLLAGAIFAGVARTLLVLREHFTASPCTACPLGAFPTCAWNLPRLQDPLLRAALADVERRGAWADVTPPR